MPNTKEVEQAAKDFTEANPQLMHKSDVFIAGYNYALSNPLEQSELQQQYNKLKEAFKYACKEYIHEDVIKECMNRAGLEQSEKKEEWVSCKDRLPDFGVKVLVFGEQSGMNPQMGGAYISISERMDLKGTQLARDSRLYVCEHGFKRMTYVTLWMPLPKAPKPPKNLV